MEDDVFDTKPVDSPEKTELDASLITSIKTKRRSCNQSKRKVVSPTPTEAEVRPERKKSRNSRKDDGVSTTGERGCNDKKNNNNKNNINKTSCSDNGRVSPPTTPTSQRKCQEDFSSKTKLHGATIQPPSTTTTSTTSRKNSVDACVTSNTTPDTIPPFCSSLTQKRSYSERDCDPTTTTTSTTTSKNCRTGSLDSHTTTTNNKTPSTSQTIPKTPCTPTSTRLKYGEQRHKQPRGLKSPISTNFDSDNDSQPSSGLLFVSPTRASQRKIQSAKESAAAARCKTSSSSILKDSQRSLSSVSAGGLKDLTVQLSPLVESSVAKSKQKKKGSLTSSKGERSEKEKSSNSSKESKGSSKSTKSSKNKRKKDEAGKRVKSLSTGGSLGRKKKTEDTDQSDLYSSFDFTGD